MVGRKTRMLAGALALVLCVSLYAAPKSKAVAVTATAASIGAAVLSSYLIATNMDMIGDTAETISNGISSLVSDWVTDTGVSDSGESWLSALGTAVQIGNPGVLIVPGALAAGCAAFVSWLTETFELDEDGDGSIVVEGTAEFYRYGSLTLPSLVPIWNQVLYPYALIGRNSSVDQIYVIFSSYEFVNLGYPSYNIAFGASVPVCPVVKYVCVNNQWKLDESTTTGQLYGNSELKWCSPMIYYLNGAAAYNSSVLETVPVGDAVVGQIELLRQQGYANVAEGALDDDELAITTGLPVVTLEDLALDVPAKIASSELSPTVELIRFGEGTDPDPNPDDEEAVYPYFPILTGIRDRLDSLGDSIADSIKSALQSIVDGIMSGLQALFVPDEAFFAEAVPTLRETFQGRMGLLTFPISLLADFLGRLLELNDQEPVLRWNSVSLYGEQLISAGQYNLKDALKSAPVKSLYDIYTIAVNAILIFAFLGLCHNKYRKIMQN